MQRKVINAEDGTCRDIKDIVLTGSVYSLHQDKSVYRDRISGNREGRSVIAWYLQPLPDTRPSYSGTDLS